VATKKVHPRENPDYAYGVNNIPTYVKSIIKMLALWHLFHTPFEF